MDVEEKAKILYITGGIGGESRELEYHVNILSKIFKDCEIHAIVLYDAYISNLPSNIKIFKIERKRTLNPFGKLINLIHWTYTISKYKKKNKYILSISNADPSNLVNVISELLNNGKLERLVLRIAGLLSNISLYQNSKIYGFIYRLLYRSLYRFLYNRTKAVLFISEASKSDSISFGISAEKAKVIYNPLDTKLIENLYMADLNIYKVIFQYPAIINAGRLTKPKGQWYLLRVFKYLKESHKDLKLVILGEGEIKDYLVKLSEELGLRTFVWDRDKLSEDFDVYFLGFQKNPFKFIARSKLFVFPSLWEGFPYALIEAMACGVAVVTTDCGGNMDYVIDCYNALVVPPGNPEVIARAALRILRDNKLKEELIEGGMETAKHWTWDKMVDKFEEAIKEW